MILSPTRAAARLVERLCRLSGALASGVAALADGRPVDLLAAADALDDLAEALPAPPVEPLPGVRWPLRDLAAALRDTATALRLASPGGGGGGPPEGGAADQGGAGGGTGGGTGGGQMAGGRLVGHAAGSWTGDGNPAWGEESKR